ncbi:MAG: biotin carboxylase N-terminal domain-containing protein [Jatrophihabitans sp.]
MIESVLAADGGLGALRVVRTCQRLGIKAVALTSADRVNKQARKADDVVLLSEAEWSSAAAVVAAAKAADVDAVHPGLGPLAGDAVFAEEADAAGLVAAVATGSFGAGEIVAALAAESISFRAGPAEFEVLVFGTDSGVVVLGDLGVDGECHVAPARGLSDAEREAVHRTGHAVGVVLSIRGLASIGMAADQVCGVRPGLAPGQSAWEMASGVDLVELQLTALTGELPAELLTAGPPLVTGFAITGEAPATDADAPAGMRREVFAAGNEERVRITVHAADEIAARAAFAAALFDPTR